MVTLVAYVVLAIAVSFLCSILEAVLLSISPAYVVSLEQKNSRWAPLVKELTEHIDRPLAAILTLNTIAHTIGAAVAGAQAAKVFGDAYLGAFSAVLTLLILLLSEIIPKTIGATWWQQLVPFMAVSVRAMVKMLLPLIWITEILTSKLTHKKQANPYLRDEIRAMADLGHQLGALQGVEAELMKNMLKFRDLEIVKIMTPRSVMFALPDSMSTDDYVNQFAGSGFTRIPVYGTDPDDINGFVIKNDILLSHFDENKTETFRHLKRPIITVLDKEPLPKLMATFLEKRSHIAIVVTEYGDVRGIVTLEDMIETLLGREIVDESDEIVDMQQAARTKWAARLTASA
ncbi:CNNM domain-containing protein [Parendozoicomonas haliclonae]|uniref:Magnesium and cobalt efflux protein CorC n=1 Tax=Parendozoicomonas haliclonae TaxID=1960125 RepID=A0A1X7AJ86_9GAMM|nr:CNNM domain-containing protein [Parendozoicomonas haliclonae]SMA45500.1 Magnesium and cobalt efflux protein CorC [Parendozoicomonas haliclonae]